MDFSLLMKLLLCLLLVGEILAQTHAANSKATKPNAASSPNVTKCRTEQKALDAKTFKDFDGFSFERLQEIKKTLATCLSSDSYEALSKHELASMGIELEWTQTLIDQKPAASRPEQRGV